ncbi:hypothetical protein H8E52_10285 [bacterium]|nr:hypothetical protein [bacterium]
MALNYEWSAEKLLPRPEDLLRAQGVDPAHKAAESFRGLAEEALEIYARIAKPCGVFQEVSLKEFAEIYSGEGQNAEESPLAEIFPRAEALALFAITLGPEIVAHIAALFDAADFPLAAMLDTAASEGTELAAGRMQHDVENHWMERKRISNAARGLRYSPGYCGWHVSSQKKLFAALGPDPAGIKLRDSCLMEPLKSVSGVIVAGPPSIQDFGDAHPFFVDSQMRYFRERILCL